MKEEDINIQFGLTTHLSDAVTFWELGKRTITTAPQHWEFFKRLEKDTKLGIAKSNEILCAYRTAFQKVLKTGTAVSYDPLELGGKVIPDIYCPDSKSKEIQLVKIPVYDISPENGSKINTSELRLLGLEDAISSKEGLSLLRAVLDFADNEDIIGTLDYITGCKGSYFIHTLNEEERKDRHGSSITVNFRYGNLSSDVPSFIIDLGNPQINPYGKTTGSFRERI